MRMRYFGDSYDIIKKSFIAWLTPLGPWKTHPMFSEEVSAEHADSLVRFLDTPLLSSSRLVSRTNREEYFAVAAGEKAHVFLDPDTGIRCDHPKQGSSGHIYGDELVRIARSRPAFLTLVFDQSYARGREEAEVNDKFAFFDSSGLHSVAYWSHAPFFLLCCDG